MKNVYQQVTCLTCLHAYMHIHLYLHALVSRRVLPTGHAVILHTLVHVHNIIYACDVK